MESKPEDKTEETKKLQAPYLRDGGNAILAILHRLLLALQLPHAASREARDLL